jgi:hypothetical protein
MVVVSGREGWRVANLCGSPGAVWYPSGAVHFEGRQWDRLTSPPVRFRTRANRGLYVLAPRIT